MPSDGLNMFRHVPTLAWLAGLAFAGGALLGSYDSGGSDTAVAVSAAASSPSPSASASPSPKPSVAATAPAKPAPSATNVPTPLAPKRLTAPSAAAAGSASASANKGVAVQGRITTLIKLQPTKLGAVVADDRGHTAYRYDRDSQKPSRSHCYGRCARLWLPLLVNDKTLAGANLDISKFGFIERNGGVQQLTYKGWPLYLYKGDRYAGSLKGNDGAYGTWHAALG